MHSDENIPLDSVESEFGTPQGDFTEAPPQRNLSGLVVQTGNNDSVRFSPLSKVTQ